MKQFTAFPAGKYKDTITRSGIAFATLISAFILSGCPIQRLSLNAQYIKRPAGYLFVTFQEEYLPMGEQIYFALSSDGLQWEALNKSEPMLISHLGEQGVRDPFILRSQDGKRFYLLATDLNVYKDKDWKRAREAGSKSIVIWESADLLTWSVPRLVQVAPDDAGSTWAPEAIYDEETGDYLVFWASVTGQDSFHKRRIWACRTKDFKVFSRPFLYIDKPNTILDATVIQDGTTYYRFIKDTKFNALTMESSTGLNGPWKDISGFNLARLEGYEGPACFLIKAAGKDNRSTWALAIDNYAKNGGYQVWLTDNLPSGIFSKQNSVSFPFKFRHGSVLSLTADEYGRLTKFRGLGPH